MDGRRRFDEGSRRVLRVGIVGLGRMGRSHLLCLEPMRGVTVVAGADPDPSAREAAERLGLSQTYADFSELLAHHPLDGMIVATPEDHHLAPSLACLGRGIPVLLEKPITISLEEADQLLDAERYSDAWIMPGHLVRFVPAYQSVAVAARSGQYGELLCVTAQRVRRQGDAAVYSRVHPLWVTMIHDVDVALWMFGVEPVRAHVVTRGPDLARTEFAAAMLEFPNGGIATLTTGWLLPNGQGPEVLDRLQVFGRGGVAVVEVPTGVQTWSDQAWNVPDLEYEPHTLTGIAGGLYHELEYFCRCLEQHTAPALVTLSEAVATVRVVDDMIRGAQSGLFRQPETG